MSSFSAAAGSTVRIATGRKSRDRDSRSLVFLGALWFSLFFGIFVLAVLIIDTFVHGLPRFDRALLFDYGSTLAPERTGFRAGILGSLWLMMFTALMAVPMGIAAAVHLEEFADKDRWYNRFVEVNLQNLAAVPAIVYGLLAVSVMALIATRRDTVIGGAVALALLILPVIIITTREAIRAVPSDIRFGSLALGATTWQTTWRQVLPSAVPGIATGTILGLSRAIGEAAPLLMLGLAVSGGIRFDPTGMLSPTTALPIEIYGLASRAQLEYQQAASAAIIVLLVMVLVLNGLAIFIRNKFQRSW